MTSGVITLQGLLDSDPGCAPRRQLLPPRAPQPSVPSWTPLTPHSWQLLPCLALKHPASPCLCWALAAYLSAQLTGYLAFTVPVLKLSSRGKA